MSELFLSEEPWLSRLKIWFEQYQLFLLAGLGGLLLLFGGFSFVSGVFEQPRVEVLETNTSEQLSGTIAVEIAGAVSEPGVYELLASDRVERLLIASGGLSAEADRDWVEKNINRAAKLIDGQKIYIPKQGETAVYSLQSAVKGANAVAGSTGLTGSTVVNINIASQKELESLKGIGPARAQSIIENRPYGTIDELVNKKVISKKLFDEIRAEIIAQ